MDQEEGVTRKPFLILGIGNEILTDDGIGIRLVRDLQKCHPVAGVDFLEATLGGMELVELVKDYDCVVLIDALKTGMYIPGTVLCLSPDDLRDTSHISNFHDIDFLTALELAGKTGMQIPSSVSVIAVEIVEDRTFSCELSPQIFNKYPAILEEVLQLTSAILGSHSFDHP